MAYRNSYNSYRGSRRRGGFPLLPILAAAAMVLLAVAAVKGLGPFQALHSLAAEHSVPPAEDTAAPAVQDTQMPASQGSQPPASQNVPDSSAAPDPSAAPAASGAPDPSAAPSSALSEGEYQFGVPLGETEPVPDDSVFDNAVFLGDSRTEGLQAFGGIKHGTYYWDRGMNVFRAVSEDYRVFEVDGEEVNLVETLQDHQYDAVYLMLGINEMGYPVSSYESALYALLDAIREAQPDAVLYLQTMPPVNEPKCVANGLGSWLTNENVEIFNQVITQAAADKQWVLLDTASIYRAEDGTLPADATADGVHFNVSGYGIWAEFLRCHYMDQTSYLESRE